MFRPDLATLRRVPWQEGTALVMGDLAWEDGSRCAASPRQVLKAPAGAAGRARLGAYAGTELEFIVVPRQLRGGLEPGPTAT